MTIAALREKLAAHGVDLTHPPAQRVVGCVPLSDGHELEILAPVPIFFSAAQAKAYGAPCYAVGQAGERWLMTYTAPEADLGFTGKEGEIAARLIEYLRRNWRGRDIKVDALLRELDEEAGETA